MCAEVARLVDKDAELRHGNPLRALKWRGVPPAMMWARVQDQPKYLLDTMPGAQPVGARLTT